MSLLDVPATLLARARALNGRRAFAGGTCVLTQTNRLRIGAKPPLQISESRVGRAIRTPEYTYAVRACAMDTACLQAMYTTKSSFYVLKEDPYQQNNLAADPAWAQTRAQLAQVRQKMEQAGETPPEIQAFRVCENRRKAMSETKHKGA